MKIFKSNHIGQNWNIKEKMNQMKPGNTINNKARYLITFFQKDVFLLVCLVISQPPFVLITL